MPNIPRIYSMKNTFIMFKSIACSFFSLMGLVEPEPPREEETETLMTQKTIMKPQLTDPAILQVKKSLKDTVPEQVLSTLMHGIQALTNLETDQKQESEKKITDILKETIVTKIQSFQNPSFQKEYLEEKKEQKKLIAKVTQKQQNVLKEVDSLEKEIQSSGKKESLVEILEKVNDRKEEFTKKKQEIKNEYKPIFEEGYQKENESQKTLFISSEKLSFDELREKLQKKFLKNSAINFSFQKRDSRIPIKLRGGNKGFGFQLNFKLDKNEIVKQMESYMSSIQKAATASQKSRNVIKDSVESYRLKFDQLKKRFKQVKGKKQQIIKKAEDQSKFKIEIVIVIDTTGSMSSLIEGVRIQIKNIIKDFLSTYPNATIRVGIIGYKDHPVGEAVTSPIQSFSLNTSITEAQKFVDGLQATGGGDYPEAVYDGLNQVRTMQWSSNSFKKVFLIADAPPHGKQFNESGDSYPDGCPCGITLTQIVDYFKKNSITFCFQSCGSNPLQKVKSIFRANFGDSIYTEDVISKDTLGTKLTSSLLSEMKNEMDAMLSEIELEFKKICDQVIETVKNDIESIITEFQTFKETCEVEQELKDFEEYVEGMKEAKELLERRKKQKITLEALERMNLDISTLEQTLKTHEGLKDKSKLNDLKIIVLERERVRKLKKRSISQRSILRNLKQDYLFKSDEELNGIISKCLEE